jgi:hypothetical protein
MSYALIDTGVSLTENIRASALGILWGGAAESSGSSVGFMSPSQKPALLVPVGYPAFTEVVG